MRAPRRTGVLGINFKKFDRLGGDNALDTGALLDELARFSALVYVQFHNDVGSMGFGGHWRHPTVAPPTLQRCIVSKDLVSAIAAPLRRFPLV